MNKQKTVKRYQERFNKYGVDSRSLGWSGGLEVQNSRFNSFLKTGIQRGDSVLDIGCGFGDLYAFLAEKSLAVDYHGIDICQEFLEVAKQKHPEVIFENRDVSKIKGSYDFCVAIGIFNYYESKTEHLKYISNTIETMWQLSKKAVFVDFLSPFVDYKAQNSFHIEIADIFNLVNHFTQRFELDFSYKKYELSVRMYKEEN